MQQKKYLAQVYNISPDYAEGVFDRLPRPQFKLKEVEGLAEGAELWYKEKAFRPDGNKRTGYAPAGAVYAA